MSYLTLFLTFFKIGAFTFGGGYAMLPLIQAEVLANNWLTENEIINFIAVSESTPGPFAVNIATYIGSQVGEIGFLGAFCATLGVVLPSFLIILIIARCYEKFKSSKVVKALMSGLKPAVIGLIATALLSMAKTVFFENAVSLSTLNQPMTYLSLGTVVVMSVLAFKKVHPVVIIFLSAIVGLLAGYLL
ncbi:MAG: chromate transporter [Clostridia bacterium]|nr:chromate transporter [Clostridia bacterium]